MKFLIIIDLYFLFIIKSKNLKSNNYLIISLNKISNLNKINNYNYSLNNFINSEIYINLTIGSENQNIPIFLNQSRYETIISGQNTSYIYKFLEFKSHSYNIINEPDNKNKNIESNEYKQGIHSVDKIKFYNTNYNDNFHFLLITEFSNKFIEKNILGLKLEGSIGEINKYKSYHFINQLNNINKKIYTIQFFKNSYFDFNGNIIFGLYPHEVFPDKFFILNMKRTHSIYDFWSIEFDKIAYDNSSIASSRIVFFNIEFGIILGSDYLYRILKRDFFDELYKKHLCWERNESFPKIFIECDKTVKINEFKNINFYLRSENFSFIFDYNDLFIKIDDKYLFLICFDKNTLNRYIFGKLFFQKYQMTFNFDSKMIYWYDNNLKNSNKHYIYFNYSFFLNFFFLIIIIFLLVLLIKVYLNKPRKKKANELNDDFYYNQIEVNLINNK